MKAYLLLSLALIFVMPLHAQEVVLPTPKLRSAAISFLGFYPYTSEVSHRIDSLIRRPDFTLVKIIEKSDTSLFYLKGYRSNFNPFKTKIDSVKIIIAEIKIVKKLTNKVLDTLVYFQTEGTFSKTATEYEIRKEFANLHKEISRLFYTSIYSKEKESREWVAEAYNYYFMDNRNRVMNLTWKNRKKKWTTITISFITKLH